MKKESTILNNQLKASLNIILYNTSIHITVITLLKVPIFTKHTVSSLCRLWK